MASKNVRSVNCNIAGLYPLITRWGVTWDCRAGWSLVQSSQVSMVIIIGGKQFSYHGILPAHLIPNHGMTCYDHVMLKTKLSARTLVLTTTLTDHNNIALSISIRYWLNPAKLTNRVYHTTVTKHTFFPTLTQTHYKFI